MSVTYIWEIHISKSGANCIKVETDCFMVKSVLLNSENNRAIHIHELYLNPIRLSPFSKDFLLGPVKTFAHIESLLILCVTLYYSVYYKYTPSHCKCFTFPHFKCTLYRHIESIMLEQICSILWKSLRKNLATQLRLKLWRLFKKSPPQKFFRIKHCLYIGEDRRSTSSLRY